MSIAAVAIAGIVLFIWPFLGFGLPPEVPTLAVTLGAVAVLGLMEAGARRLDSGRLALLAALAAIDAALNPASPSPSVAATPSASTAPTATVAPTASPS